MTKIHCPPHLYLDNQYYFITARIYKEKQLLNSDFKKNFILKCLRNEFSKFKYSLFAWVIVSNHYHIIFKTSRGEYLPKILNKVHGFSSYKLNKIDKTQGRKIWQNYFDKCMRNKKDFWMHFNYIHNNPIKHGLVKDFDDLKNYQFSSFNFYLKKFGKKWLIDTFEQYPIIDFTKEDDFEAMKS